MKKTVNIIFAALALLLCGCGTEPEPVPVQTVDPYAGMVEVESGYGTKMWVKEYEDVAVSALTAADFTDGVYTGTDFAVSRGIDVSEHQGTVDWGAAADGVDFAVIRVGYRGYGEAGTLCRDAYYQENLSGAAENGVPMGAYFFSQAVNVGEAEEEAEFLLELLAPWGPEAFDLPVFFDWEDISHDTARTDGLDGGTITDCAAAFCEKIRAAGYTPGIYAYRYLGYYSYDLLRLNDYVLWIGAVNSYPDFYYAHEFWQYSTAGQVDGISGNVDLDMRFLAKEKTE